MHKQLISWSSILCAGVPLFAQDVAKPAPELAQLKILEGNWEGAGTVELARGAPPTKWTLQSTNAWVLGGFFLQDDITIEFEGGVSPPLQFREYKGWDAENRRYVVVSVGNEGRVELATMHFPTADTMLTLKHTLVNGLPVATREITKVDADSISFTVTNLGAEGPAHDYVRGTMKRVAKSKPQALEAAMHLGPQHAEMATLAKMVGSYEVTGEMTPMPGMPTIPIHGRDVWSTLFGGTVVQQVTHGDPTGDFPAYEANAFYAWNPDERCFDVVSVTNMGEVAKLPLRHEGNALVGVIAGRGMGQSMALRMVTALDKDGRIARVTGHACIGEAAPIQNFKAEYKTTK